MHRFTFVCTVTHAYSTVTARVRSSPKTDGTDLGGRGVRAVLISSPKNETKQHPFSFSSLRGWETDGDICGRCLKVTWRVRVVGGSRWEIASFTDSAGKRSFPTNCQRSCTGTMRRSLVCWWKKAQSPREICFSLLCRAVAASSQHKRREEIKKTHTKV